MHDAFAWGLATKPASFRKRRAAHIAIGLLLIVPLTLGAIGPILRFLAGPFHISAVDPDYAYLFNGLNIVNGLAPAQIDHPGTTLQLLCALVIAVAWLLRRPFEHAEITSMVLHDPDYFLWSINITLATINAAADFFLGWQVWRATHKVWIAIVVQLAIFLSTVSIWVLSHSMPEPLIIGLTLLLVGFVVPVVFGDEPIRREWFAFAVGAVLGCEIVLKLTTLPLMLFLLLPRGARGKLLGAVGFLAAAVLMSYPIRHRYGDLLGWIWALAIHQNVHVNRTGVPSFQVLAANATDLLKDVPELLAILAFDCVALALSLVGARPPRSRVRTLLVLCALTVGGQLVLVARSPLPYYLIPAIALSGLIVALAIQVVRTTMPKWLGAIVISPPLAYAALHLWVNARFEFQSGVASRSLPVIYEAFMAKMAASRCMLVGWDGVPSLQHALSFGNNFAGGAYDAELAKLYPDYTWYEPNIDEFKRFSGVVNRGEIVERLARGECIYMVGGLLSRFTGFAINTYGLQLVIKTNQGSDSLAAYRLVSLGR